MRKGKLHGQPVLHEAPVRRCSTSASATRPTSRAICSSTGTSAASSSRWAAPTRTRAATRSSRSSATRATTTAAGRSRPRRQRRLGQACVAHAAHRHVSAGLGAQQRASKKWQRSVRPLRLVVIRRVVRSCSCCARALSRLRAQGDARRPRAAACRRRGPRLLRASGCRAPWLAAPAPPRPRRRATRSSRRSSSPRSRFARARQRR